MKEVEVKKDLHVEVIISKDKPVILFDDETKNRDSWVGLAYDEKNILEILKNLLTNA